MYITCLFKVQLSDLPLTCFPSLFYRLFLGFESVIQQQQRMHRSTNLRNKREIRKFPLKTEGKTADLDTQITDTPGYSPYLYTPFTTYYQFFAFLWKENQIKTKLWRSSIRLMFTFLISLELQVRKMCIHFCLSLPSLAVILKKQWHVLPNKETLHHFAAVCACSETRISLVFFSLLQYTIDLSC